jgi:hypothetical protein
MSFWAFVTILVILGIMFGALYVSKVATQREIDENEKKKKIRSMRNDLIDIDEILNTLLIYDRNISLLKALSERMNELISEGLRLLPDSEHLKADVIDLEKINSNIQALENAPKEPETPHTDRQIFLLKRQFAKSVRLIKELHAEGHISELDSGNHRTRLIQNALMLEVKAYKKQGDDAKANKEVSSAANFYKHAKELLVNSELKFSSKTEEIKEVSKRISGLYITVDEKKDENE